MNIQHAHHGHRLSWLLDGVVTVPAAADLEVTGLALDSRKVRAGDLFLACRGESAHGARYIGEAVAAGAVAVVTEPEDDGNAPVMPQSVPGWVLPDLRRITGTIASRFHGEPSRFMTVTGVTGTNGKTTVSHLVAQALEFDGRRCGVLGTVGYGFPGKLARGTHTTPDPVNLHRLLADLRGQGAAAVAIEVSSHALVQHRTGGVHFTVAAFTNLSRDHLDYHTDLESYGRAKQRLFEYPGLAHAVINTDDAFGRELLRALPPRVAAIAVGSRASGTHPGPFECARDAVEVTHLDPAPDGLRLRLVTHEGEIEFGSRLIGAFNAHNLALTAGILLALGMTPAAIGKSLAAALPVPGRMEAFGGGDAPLAIVDYAHTPDALEQVLRAARTHCRGTLWCMFGCGGDRDRGKRPLMGAVAAAWADRVCITDDNPRSEDPARIVEDVIAGMPSSARYDIEHDRARAIAGMLEAAVPGDVVVVAGKGHEDYQAVGAEIRPYSDRDTVVSLVQGEWP